MKSKNFRGMLNWTTPREPHLFLLNKYSKFNGIAFFFSQNKMVLTWIYKSQLLNNMINTKTIIAFSYQSIHVLATEKKNLTLSKGYNYIIFIFLNKEIFNNKSKCPCCSLCGFSGVYNASFFSDNVWNISSDTVAIPF